MLEQPLVVPKVVFQSTQRWVTPAATWSAISEAAPGDPAAKGQSASVVQRSPPL